MLKITTINMVLIWDEFEILFSADEWVDQFMRSLPLLVIPMLIAVNMDMLFLQYGMMFYVYGVYLHWGYEHPKLSAHNKYVFDRLSGFLSNYS